MEKGGAPDAKIKIEDAISYWNSVEADVNGMLGGFPQVSRIDLRGSANFLGKLRRQLGWKSSLVGKGVDCGAGIGRITKDFLSKVCQTVDVVEPVEKFTQEVKHGEDFASLRENGKLGTIFNEGLELWSPTEDSYDLIWNQWCLGHLPDARLIDYFRRCKFGLKTNGVIVVKENTSTDADGEDVFDELDSSVTRSHEKFLTLFRESGLKLVRTDLQAGFPKSLGLHPVRMYALQPAP